MASIYVRDVSENALTTLKVRAANNMWPYDAAYVALAESLGAQLVTIDAKLEKAPGIRCEIVRPR